MNTAQVTTIPLDEAVLAEARRFNRKLAWAPRFRMRHRFAPRLLQCLLCLSQLGGDWKLARRGCRVEQQFAGAEGGRVPMRIIRPPGPVRGVVLDVHGGGWVIGNARMNDEQNVAMVAACHVAVVSVDYRLAGRTTLRGMIDDCLAAARWLLSGDGLPEYHDLPVVIVGESAGAHLAAATLLRLKARPDLLRRVRGALLYYGLYDLTGTASVRQAGPETLVLDGPDIVAALRRLTPGLSDAQRREPPLYGELDGFPPALMFTGELDPLRDDTIELAARWRKVAQVELHFLPEAPHGFIHFSTGLRERVVARSHQWLHERMDPLCPANLAATGESGTAR